MNKKEEEPTDAAKAEIAWAQFKSRKGYTTDTLNMLLHEFIKSKELFKDLILFIGQKK